MGRSIVYYVTGHGYGHARRAAEVIRALHRRSDNLSVHVRTSAPRWLFEGLASVTHHAADIDPGCAEADLLTIDPRGTADRVRDYLRRSDAIVEAEAAFIRDHPIDLIVADIPFLAGDISHASGVPCAGISNFTWDWIYEGLFPHLPDAQELIGRIRRSYGKMSALLRIPWGGVAPSFPRVIDCPLIASIGSAPAIFDKEDTRPRVLVVFRGGIDAAALDRVARQSPEYLFVQAGPLTPDLPENLLRIPPEAADFSDLLAASDVVVSKVGYGIIADCIAGKKRLLWPRRTGFREDAMSEVCAREFIAMQELPIDDLREGRWSEHLRALLSTPMPAPVARTDGADCCAAALVGFLR